MSAEGHVAARPLGALVDGVCVAWAWDRAAGCLWTVQVGGEGLGPGASPQGFGSRRSFCGFPERHLGSWRLPLTLLGCYRKNYIYTHTHIHTHLPTCTFTCRYIYIYLHVHIDILFTYAYINTCIYL